MPVLPSPQLLTSQSLRALKVWRLFDRSDVLTRSNTFTMISSNDLDRNSILCTSAKSQMEGLGKTAALDSTAGFQQIVDMLLFQAFSTTGAVCARMCTKRTTVFSLGCTNSTKRKGFSECCYYTVSKSQCSAGNS